MDNRTNRLGTGHALRVITAIALFTVALGVALPARA